MTFENALKKIETSFEKVDAKKLTDMAVQVTLTDEDCGGTLYFKSENGTIDVQGYDYRDNDATIDIDRKAFMDVLAGKITLDKAIEKGLATVKGDFEKLNTLNAAIPVLVTPKKKVETTKPVSVVKSAETKSSTKKSTPTKKTTTKTTTTAKAATTKTTTAKATAATKATTATKITVKNTTSK